MPNFSSLARLEVPEKFVWGGGLGLWGGLHSHFRVKPNCCVVLCLGWGWGFDNIGLCKVHYAYCHMHSEISRLP